MNLLCPNCQKMLTVPEQFAGQLMKCPLCSGTFTVPALPSGGDVIAPPPPSIPPTPAFTPPSTINTPALPESPIPFAPETSTAPPEPAFLTSSPKPQPSIPTGPSSSPSTTSSAASATSTALPEGYTRRVQLHANEHLLQHVPLACLALVFVLQFFSWVGVYPGGVPAVTQNAWQAAFAGYSSDPDMKEKFRVITEKDAADLNERKKVEYKEISNEPGISLLTLFYLVPFYLVTLAFAGFVAIQPRLSNVKLPPQLAQMLPWKWTILAALNGILLLFLGLQLALNFSLESSVKTWIENKPEVKYDKDAKTEEVKVKTALLGNYVGQIHRTNTLYLVFLLHVLATVSAGMVYWLERRGPNKPLPTLELRW